MAIEKTVVKVSEPLDHFTSCYLKDKIFQALESGNSNVVLDFGGLSYLDSGGMSVIIKTLRKIKEKNGLLEIIGVNKNIKRIFEISALEKLASPLNLRVEFKKEENLFARETTPRPTHFLKKIRVPASPRYLNKIRLQIRSILSDIGFSDELIFDVVVSVSEACSNSIEHGSASARHSIEIICDYKLGQLTIDVFDTGQGFIEEEAVRRQYEDPTRGRGVALIKRLMDDVSFEKKDKGFLVRMKKYQLSNWV
jgi:anti-anti-sigma factor